MVPLRILTSLFILIILASNTHQEYEYSELQEAKEKEVILNDTVDTPVKENFDNTKGRKSARRVFAGGCTRRPNAPVNGRITCFLNSGCVASCASDYKFPNGVYQLTITCIDKEWHIQDTEWSSIPHCEPICMPECQNNGICIAPHQCDCPEHFTGPQCQFEDKPCLNHPPPVLNSYKKCNSKSCTISCIKHFTFPDGSSITNLICKDGSWRPTRGDWISIPDCEPVCDPPCQNGGNCLPMNLCQCPQDYRGSQCQYSASACDPENLRFNGGYHCKSVDDAYSCILNCPAGVEFEFPPASAYICNYDKGTFEPQPIPQCKIENDMSIIPISTSYDVYVQESNQTWSTQDFFDTSTKHSSEFHHAYYDNQFEGRTTVVEENREPRPKTCFTWSGVHYKTFDDRIYNFDSNCSHVLLREMQNDVCVILIQNNPSCKMGGHCSRIVKLFVHDKEYTLSSDETGTSTFYSGKRSLPIPVYLPGLRVDKAAHFILVSIDSLGMKLKWDGSLLLQIEASESMWNKTAGLCGTMNDDPNDDLLTKSGSHAKSITALADSWRVNNLGETCDDYPNTQHACKSKDEITRDGYDFCIKLLSKREFKHCADTINLSELTKACLWDYCECKHIDKRKCACDTMDVYIRQCSHKENLHALTAWRNNDTCPISCDNGRVYMSCGPKVEASCFSGLEAKSENFDCEEGCFCPMGTLEHQNKCVVPEACPCKLRGKLFEPGTSVPKGCNTCTCSAGKWLCTQIRCAARCAVVGDPHYTTFDGKHYDFMGKCTYYLIKGDNYTIESENVLCSGAISQSMGFVSVDSPSCTKIVTINIKNTSIKLKQNRQITVNGDEVTKFPLLLDGVRIRVASSIFLVIKLFNGLEIWWDGVSRVYINAPAEFHGKTKGLCGTFTENQKDDFVTPDGDIEPTVMAFANKWRASEYCVDDTVREMKHPCELNPQKRSIAEEYCSKIYTDIFSACHWHVDPTEYYRDCMYDMCACDTDVKSCLCPVLGAYAESCAMLDVKLSWRSMIDECKVHCSGGQIYQICGNSCTRSCEDISFYQDCKQECVEGCNCPVGQTLNTYGECIPTAECPCIYGGREYKPNHREVRPGNKGQEYCACLGGTWECRLATSDEIQEYPPIKELLSICVASKHLEVTDYEPLEQRTCSNMHIPNEHSLAVCTSACVCKAGYVLDAPNGVCIQEKDCPCHHGGKSYKEGSIIQAECNTCTCEGTKWKCTDRICAGVCSVWGDSHYKTFDGKMYDFQGICDYILVKSALSKEESFDVIIQNVPCGTNGVACSKSITLVIGNGEQQEELVLTKGKKLPEGPFQRMIIRVTDLFVFVDVPDLGLVLQWDKGTRVYVRLNPTWKGRTLGLCGDYNDNAEDDFKTPSGGISEAAVNLFGDSWKKNTFCPEPKDVPDSCEQHPERKLWSLRKCNVLKSSLFSPCHSEVDVEPYVNNCIFDACSCDSGGDCECLCTALAAYAHECNVRGVPVRWRSQELCPLQCDESYSNYSPCVSTCPYKTCDNLMTVKHRSHLCAEDTCVEGCQIKLCPEDQVYWNVSYTECIPKAMCKTPFCAEINGVTFYEGDRVSGDDCQSCFCSRGKVTCKGKPCINTTTTTATVIVTVPQTEPQKCIDGWSAWINRDQAVKGKKFLDVEPLPDWMDLANANEYAVCNREHIVDIRCRSVKGHLNPKESGLDVECSLERGLYCQSHPDLPCVDFEISVLCHCPESMTHGFQDATTGVSTIGQTIDECDVERPNAPHPTNCQLFYQCVRTSTGLERVEKSCGLGTLYNPKIQVCDFATVVLQTRPECSAEQTVSNKTKWEGTSLESTLSTLANEVVSTTSICKNGETWSECAIQCSRACQYYHHILTTQGHCSEGTDCVAGCVSIERPMCPPHRFWRDDITCVDANECSCQSHSGDSIAPGAVKKESDCKICQCVNNYYTCDSTLCVNVTTTNYEMQSSWLTTLSKYTLTTSVTQSSVNEYTILHSTVSPLTSCDNANYVPLIRDLHKEVSVHASSSIAPVLEPENLSVYVQEIPSSDVGFWEPVVDDTHQWLDIKFGRPEPVYGIILQGAVTKDKFVTSYKVLYSEDGQTFSYVLNHDKKPYVFRGPLDRIHLVEQIFYQPIEARVIRINPLTWHNGIGIRMEVLGCQDNIASTSETKSTKKIVMSEKVIKPVCEDLMGLDNGLMSIEQVSVSSSPQLVQHLLLSSKGVWRPALNNPHQYVQFDFLEPRNLTGVITKGGVDAWTTAYKISYSNDGRNWNPVVDEDGNEKEFLGNFDAESPKKNFFERPLHARYIRIQPTKWHDHIAMKVEVLGCYLTYPVTSFKTTFESTTPSLKQRCNVCDGIDDALNDESCRCEDPFWWDGDSCRQKQECPCVVGHIPYAVGSVYETEDCQECICAIGGTAMCMPKKCEPCGEQGLQSIISELCTCLCKPCPTGTRHCPTSDVCVNETAWCNGVQDCPDDETNCPQIAPTTPMSNLETTSTTDHKIIVEKCEEPICPPNYRINYKPILQNRHDKNYHTGRAFTKTKGSKKRPVYGHPIKGRNHQLTTESARCLTEFTCVPVKPPPILNNEKRPEYCPEASCPPSYEVVYEKMSMYKLHKCPKYACRRPTPQMAVCNVTGRTFSTFDDMEYKYDVCNHILVRNMYNNEWYITLEKQCDSSGRICTRILVITMNDRVIVLHPDLHANIDEYTFTAAQIARFGNRFSDFELSHAGNGIVFVSHHHGFLVIWDTDANVKIGIHAKLANSVDGLCGYYDGNMANDRRTPDGTQAKSTVQFGNSWAMEDTSQCNPHTCPRDIQEQAWTICNSVKSPMLLDACSAVIDLDRFMSHCVEDACLCLRNNSSHEDCQCRLLTSFVSECEAIIPDVDLSDWRTIHDCPSSCQPPFVHRDCFRNKCEVTCDNLYELEPCPPMQGVCFSGCFCPDGLVRQNDECIPPIQCRDCVCDSLGNSKFIGFNRKDFAFSGNCTYLLSKNSIENVKDQDRVHTYQILITNGNCPTGTCVKAITLLYQTHVVQIKHTERSEELQVFIDDSSVAEFPYNGTWIVLDQMSTGDVVLLLPSIQLQLTTLQRNFAFILKLPSRVFSDATEGLCGNCNADSENGFKKSNGEITDDVTEFSRSWLVDDMPTISPLNGQSCSSNKTVQCAPPPADEDICRKLLDLAEFQQCHSIVDPKPYLDCCHDALCTDGNYCDSLEMYARKCSEASFCPAWRTDDICPYECPNGLVYQPCASDCKETCDTLNTSNKLKCSSGPVEGCFCPEDYVLHNDSCIPKRNCFVCDKDGHIEGDIWHPDKCTECNCHDGIVSCQKTECPMVDTICEENLTPMLVNGTEERCCAKYLCVPKSTAPSVCIESQEPECGFGQTMKIITDNNGCHKFVCQCLLASECPVFDEFTNEVENLEPGFVQVMNTSGCCPRPTKICDQSTCPSAPNCPNYYNAIMTTHVDSCCPTYECVPPKDVCLYTKYGAQDNQFVIPKQIGEEWKDNCKTCVCENSYDGPKANCMIMQCPSMHAHPDINDYILEEILLDDECCPIFKRTACKDKDKVYDIDESWKPNAEDACITMQCDEQSGNIQKRIKVQECNSACDYGYEYQPSNNTALNCCGTCVEIACIVEGMLKNVGEQWQSDDFCVTYLCDSVNGSMFVQTSTETCPEVDPQLEAEFEIEVRKISGKCCPEITKTACRSNGKLYKPGTRWKSPSDNCVTEICATELDIVKHREVETCTKQCAEGWSYQEPEDGKCCGKCKQTFCVFEDSLYEPGITWSSVDNCTTYTCLGQGEQLSLSVSPAACPDVTNCPDISIYYDQCCKRCNLTVLNQLEKEKSKCQTTIMGGNSTLGMLIVNHPLYGKCKNLEPIKNIKRCSGMCQSSTYFDGDNWNLINNCQCCQANEYTATIVNLTCEDGRRLKKQLVTPTSCSCQSCSLSEIKSEHRKTKTNTKS